MEMTIRPIEPADNAALAHIIRSSLLEFGANKPGTVFYDPTTDALAELFCHKGAAYFVATAHGVILGGAGVYPTPGLPEYCCELVKMYLRADARDKGLGRKLIAHSLEIAASLGYRQVYLETMPELRKAVSVYEKFGFRYLEGPLGNSGHFGCDVWMMKELPISDKYPQ
jgi:putative acetyltransferase